MFNRYWRSYPWYFQMFQFMILIGIMFSFFVGVLGGMVLKSNGYTQASILGLNEHSSYNLVQVARLMQGIISIGLFLVVPLLFAYVTHPRPAQYLGFRSPRKPVHILLVIILMLALLPVEIQLSEWVTKLPWSADTRTAVKEMEQRALGMMQFRSIADYFITMFLVAVIPAIGEEMFFRGVIMRYAAKILKNMWVQAMVTALIFALSHPDNVFNYPGIFLAGSVLGLIYYLTGSLWMSVLGHFISNGVQVTLLYIASGNTGLKAAMQGNDIPGWMAGAGLAVAVWAFYMLWKTRTPLPENWSDDYTPEELAAEQKEGTI
jgi:membrane protease YdiL (CAAX protease family)